MGLKRTFDDTDIQKIFDAYGGQIDEKMINVLRTAGEKFITDSRQQPQGHEQGFYIDRTGDLRKSIGYFIFRDGEKIYGDPGEFGSQMEIIVQPFILPKGYQLIGFAGMDYASHVEAKGYNVISNQAEGCVVNIETNMGDLQTYINNLDLRG